MTPNGWFQLALYLAVLLLLAKPLGLYMARVYSGRVRLERLLGWLERGIYRLAGVDPAVEMGWKAYAVAMLIFNFAGIIAVYKLQRLQAVLPWNPQHLPAVSPPSAFNTAVSFGTNTNWQGYGGETTMSYLTQMLGLTVQNFVSAAAGMAALAALVRGLARRSAETIGNFWVDLTRSTLYVLLPLSLVLAVVLVSQGVVQTLAPYAKVAILQPTHYNVPETDPQGAPLLDAAGQPKVKEEALTEQLLAIGPAASQVAIKQLGTNGGGFFNVNSAHPYENPTPLSNFLELLAILLIPAALCYTFGVMVGDRRQGWAVLAAMTVLFVGLLTVCVLAEQRGTPLAELGVDHRASDLASGGNMEGKETRFGIVNSALWATATTAASNGSVNAMHDSFTPLGGLVPMWMMQLGEVVYGGVGSGLYGMLVFAIIAVFIAGLMVGRTPEYLGKKIEAYEMKMAALVILIPPAVVLIGTAIAVVTPAAKATIFNSGAHGFSEVLYAFSSAGNNNGSAFAGLGANTLFYNTALGIAMLFARYWLAIPTLAIAGSLARKKAVPVGPGTLPTHTVLFIALLIGVVVLVGALTFIPALALGPIVEHLLLAAARS
ncbi:MAG TPA: potassium-transporting ATPase subunit KdpA [Candidatus Udaeobacter sp.]|nr:potassium-transporting ATPase subunit KdpA [Candidatus Udaeobacter sp.]